MPAVSRDIKGKTHQMRDAEQQASQAQLLTAGPGSNSSSSTTVQALRNRSVCQNISLKLTFKDESRDTTVYNRRRMDICLIYLSLSSLSLTLNVSHTLNFSLGFMINSKAPLHVI